MLLGTLIPSLLGNLLSGKGATTERPERAMRVEGMLRAVKECYELVKDILKKIKTANTSLK